jgi:putative heme-binding domain-containing protein
MMDLAALNDFPWAEQARWWLNNRKGNNWKEYGLVALMRERGLIKENPLVSVISPEPVAGASKLPPLKEILALEGDVARGQIAIAACFSCHKVGKQGIDFGPDLTAFGKTQPREVIINAILGPSAEISHGYEASRVETTQGITIDGIVVDNGDPLVVKSIGGQMQEVWRERVKSVNPLGRSLMFEPETLGLTAESIADIAAYLKSGVGKQDGTR